MKKILSYIVFLIITLQSSFAQDLNTLIDDFSKSENAQIQRIDKAILDASFEAAKASETTGILAAQVPPFMKKLDMLEILDLTECKPDVKERFLEIFNTTEDRDGYETLDTIENKNDKVRILTKKAEATDPEDSIIISDILILALNTKDLEIAIVKLTGNLDESDMEDIIKQQSK